MVGRRRGELMPLEVALLGAGRELQDGAPDDRWTAGRSGLAVHLTGQDRRQ